MSAAIDLNESVNPLEIQPLRRQEEPAGRIGRQIGRGGQGGASGGQSPVGPGGTSVLGWRGGGGVGRG